MELRFRRLFRFRRNVLHAAILFFCTLRPPCLFHGLRIETWLSRRSDYTSRRCLVTRRAMPASWRRNVRVDTCATQA